jgi:hypothetical protein
VPKLRRKRFFPTARFHLIRTLLRRRRKALEIQLHQAREAYETAQEIEDVNERRRQAAETLALGAEWCTRGEQIPQNRRQNRLANFR